MLKKFCYGFAAFLVFAAATNYIPLFKDANGYVFGLFQLDIYKDLLHLASALWAFWAARGDERRAKQFLQLFGTIYLADGVIGVLTGNSFLDLSLFFNGFSPVSSWFTRIASTVPHLTLGVLGIYAGFFLKRDA